MSPCRKAKAAVEKENPVKGIERSVLKRYLMTRQFIAKKAERITAQAQLLRLLKHCGEDTIPVSPQALAVWAQMIDTDMCSIIESLDDFIFLTDAETALDEPDN